MASRIQQQTTSERFSNLQKAILKWLYTNWHDDPVGADAGVPYPDIVRAVTTDKASVTTALRQLMGKGLVLIILPHGRWKRCVVLTEQGKDAVKTLLKQELKYTSKRFVDEALRAMQDDISQHTAIQRRDRKRDRRQRRGNRHLQRRQGSA